MTAENMEVEVAAPAEEVVKQEQVAEQKPQDAGEPASSADSSANDDAKPSTGAEDGEENKMEVDAEENEAEAAAKEDKDQDEDFSEDKPETLIAPGSVVLNEWDRTFNALGAEQGTTLASLTGDGFNQLYSAMRANKGFYDGRYYFEIKMLDHPRSVRVGFSTVECDLTMDTANAFCFESHCDAYVAGERQKNVNPRWTRTDVVGCLLNVPKKQIVLVLNGGITPTGHSATIPDSMFDESGKLKMALYPTVVSKGCSVECNFSTEVWKQLPFAVRTVGRAKIADCVESPKKRHTVLSEDDKGRRIVEVTIPVGFDASNVIEKFKAESPDAWVLTQDFLASWAEKSGAQKRAGGNQQSGRGNQSQQEKYGLMCLDNPMGVFPMLLKGGHKYLMSMLNLHNLFPQMRQDAFAKLQHALNVRIKGLVSVDSVLAVLEGKKQVVQNVRDHYEHAALPNTESEAWDTVEYVYEADPSKTQEELATLVNEKFVAWKKDCKLKSKVTDLKKGPYYTNQITKFSKLRQMQHKATAEQARKAHAATKEKLKAEKKAKKEAAAAAKKEEEKGDKEKEEGAAEPAAEEAKEESVESEEEEEVLPAIMEEFSEEDWMLAQLRCEIHSLIHAFRMDVNDPERVTFPATHMAYYYHLYSGKPFSQTLQSFNVRTLEELTKLIPDVCEHTKDMDDFALRKEKSLLEDFDLVLPASSEADLDVQKFIEVTEEARQMRTDRLDAGDENAALNFTFKQQSQKQAGNNKVDNFKRPMPNSNQYSDYNAKRSRSTYNQAASGARR
ncbi:unnamed protein product [Amoebophrya sp. A120]|nr:unnamed protein product [Amoebophrya sp. A120]|eukprot:GSA120T00024346001.1